MSGSVASTARPSHTAIAWATKDAIFVEIPCRDGPPYIARYRKTEAGLMAALNILLETPERAPRPATAEHPRIKRAMLTFSEDQRQGVRDVLKKLNIT